MFCIVVMENFGCADFVSNPGAEYSIYGYGNGIVSGSWQLAFLGCQSWRYWQALEMSVHKLAR